MRGDFRSIALLTSLALLIVATFSPSPTWGAASEWSVNEQSRVRLITPYRTAPSDGEIHLGLHFKLAPGWHVYWKNSGDAGFPPVVVFSEAAGLGEPELLWPAPERFELPGDLVAFGYENEVVYPVRARLSNAPGDVLKLTADVDYLVCEVDCIPYRYTLSLDQPLASTESADPETGPLIASWWDRLPAPAAALAGVTTEGALVAGAAGPALEVRVDGVEAGAEPPGLFLEAHEAFDTGKPVVRTTDRGVTFRVPLRPKTAGGALPQETGFAWTVTRLVRDGRPVSLEARQTVPRSETSLATAATGEAGTASPKPLFPVVAALLAVAIALLALWLWGVLGPSHEEARPGREALGFAALAAVLGLLYALSRQVSFEGLAWIELTLLGMSLCAWLRHKAADRRALRLVLGLGLLACALAAPWLADRNRLDRQGLDRQITSIEEETDA